MFAADYCKGKTGQNPVQKYKNNISESTFNLKIFRSGEEDRDFIVASGIS